MAVRTRVNILDPVRLALTTFPRIWNRSIVGWENPVKRKTQNVGSEFKKMPICSGVISRTPLFFIPGLALERKNFRGTDD